METSKEKSAPMKLLRKLLASLIFILIIVIVGRRIVRSYYSTYITDPLLRQIIGIEKLLQYTDEIQAPMTVQRGAEEYNFGRLVHLIEASIEVKHLFYTSYLEQPKRRKYIDTNAMRDLLSELYREKVRLESYIYYIKNHSNKDGFIDKRGRSLNYFQKVLNKNIREIEAILKKI